MSNLKLDNITALSMAHSGKKNIRIAIKTFVINDSAYNSSAKERNLVFSCGHANGIPKESWIQVLEYLISGFPKLKDRILAIHIYDARGQGESALLNKGLLPELDTLVPGLWSQGAVDVEEISEWVLEDAFQRLAKLKSKGLYDGDHINQCKNIKLIALGHSLGSAHQLLFTTNRLDKGYKPIFDTLICVEPVLWKGASPTYKDKLTGEEKLLPEYIEEQKKSSLIKNTLRRKDFWENREAAFLNLSSKPFFSTWTKESMKMYLKEGLVDCVRDGVKGVELKTPRISEASTFMGSSSGNEIMIKLSKYNPDYLNILLLAGTHSTFLKQGTMLTLEEVMKSIPFGKFAMISNATHMVILDQPKLSADAIGQYLTDIYIDPKNNLDSKSRM